MIKLIVQKIVGTNASSDPGTYRKVLRSLLRRLGLGIRKVTASAIQDRMPRLDATPTATTKRCTHASRALIHDQRATRRATQRIESNLRRENGATGNPARAAELRSTLEASRARGAEASTQLPLSPDASTNSHTTSSTEVSSPPLSVSTSAQKLNLIPERGLNTSETVVESTQPVQEGNPPDSGQVRNSHTNDPPSHFTVPPTDPPTKTPTTNPILTVQLSTPQAPLPGLGLPQSSG